LLERKGGPNPSRAIVTIDT